MTKGGARRRIPIAEVWLSSTMTSGAGVTLSDARVHPSGMLITGHARSGIKISYPMYRVMRIAWTEVDDPERAESA